MQISKFVLALMIAGAGLERSHAQILTPAEQQQAVDLLRQKMAEERQKPSTPARAAKPPAPAQTPAPAAKPTPPAKTEPATKPKVESGERPARTLADGLQRAFSGKKSSSAEPARVPAPPPTAPPKLATKTAPVAKAEPAAKPKVESSERPARTLADGLQKVFSGKKSTTAVPAPAKAAVPAPAKAVAPTPAKAVAPTPAKAVAPAPARAAAPAPARAAAPAPARAAAPVKAEPARVAPVVVTKPAPPATPALKPVAQTEAKPARTLWDGLQKTFSGTRSSGAAPAHQASSAATAAVPGKRIEALPAAPAPVPIAVGPRTKQQRLTDLLEAYKADKIGPTDYHEQRAKILAEP